MEANVASKANTVSNAGASETNVGTEKFKCVIKCAIRRKPGMVGLPGQDPNERSYRIGASLDSRTQKNLKGISGDLELKFMPEIIGISATDPQYRIRIEEYWSSISKVVPADNENLREHERGVPLNIEFTIIGKVRRDSFDRLTTLESKMEFLNTNLLTPISTTSNVNFATLEYDFITDYLLLNYCLKYSKVANNFADLDKSPRIDFYLFEKAIAVKTQQSNIQARRQAMELYQGLADNEMLANAVLLAFEDNLKLYDDITDKLLRIDEIYNESPAKLHQFIKVASDTTWKTKYLIQKAITLNKLRTPANSTAIYFNETLLGLNIEDAVIFLKTTPDGQSINELLEKELASKLN